MLFYVIAAVDSILGARGHGLVRVTMVVYPAGVPTAGLSVGHLHGPFG